MRLATTIALLSLALPGCASGTGGSLQDPPSPSVPARGDSRTLTEAELSRATQLSLFDYIAAERPRWLSPRRAAGARGSGVLVFLDDVRLGDPSTLRTMRPTGLRLVRFYDAAEAQAKFSVRDILGIIQIVTR